METQMEEVLESIYQKTAAHGDNIITVLQEIQNAFGYVQEESVYWKRTEARAQVRSARF